VRHDVLTDQLDEIRQPYVTVRVCSWSGFGLSTRSFLYMPQCARRHWEAKPADPRVCRQVGLAPSARLFRAGRGAWHSR